VDAPVYAPVGREIVIPTYCDDCAAKERAAEDRKQLEELKRSQARASEARNRRLAASGVSPRMCDWSFSSYPQDEHSANALKAAHDWIDDYVAGGRGNLILFGSVGVGKSGLAWAILRALIEAGADGKFVVWSEALRQVRASYSTSQPCQLMDTLAIASIVVIDDLGRERPTDHARQELSLLVERRYADLRPTIVTSNYSMAELGRRLGHDDPTTGLRIVSRLSEHAVQVRLTGADRRRLL
jgi:DNA replication protein DnaC